MGAGSATQRLDPGGPGGAFPVVEPDSWGREGALGAAPGGGLRGSGERIGVEVAEEREQSSEWGR